MDEEWEAFLKDYQHKVKELKKEVTTEEDELEKYKQELEEAQKNVDKESEKKGWFIWILNKKTDREVMAKNEKNETDYQVRKQQIVVKTKRDEVKTNIEAEKQKNNLKQKNWQLDEEKRKADRNTHMEEMETQLNKISEALTNTDEKIQVLDKKAIEKKIKEGITNVTELEACWKQLAFIFDEISDVTVMMMRKTIKDFANTAESAKLQGNVAEGSSNSLKTFTKKRLMQLSFDVYSCCNRVRTVSKGYLNISDTYLMPSIIQLGTLVAIDAEREPEKISSMAKEIQSRSQMTIDFVKEVIQSAKLVNENEVKTKANKYN